MATAPVTPRRERGSMALLHRVRAHLDRLTPQQALAEQDAGAVLIDVRTALHRADAGTGARIDTGTGAGTGTGTGSGGIPGALAIDLTVLPWRLDPDFHHRIPEATDWDARYILFCRHGYSSSLAAWSLRQMGLHRATDIVGGYEAWEAAGLPVSGDPADERP
ncbi:rhodanese-like domain-containing protein [Microbacterium sp. A93]|uniref:rhodanese-like domain-containing protein n=1 Tax=Microbacterium sp. A93 TaxID=3450716 RepID=UPI003F41BF83